MLRWFLAAAILLPLFVAIATATIWMTLARRLEEEAAVETW